jgi:hypothetical protein
MFWLDTGCSHWKTTWQLGLRDELITLIPWTGAVELLAGGLPLLTRLEGPEPELAEEVVTDRWSE